MSQWKQWTEAIPAKYQPIPFWSWNDKLDIAELRRQVRWMYDNGIGGFFMHARGGLKTPYLSEEWMQAVDACCDEAQQLGMNAWAYDENGWPSGFAGGKLLEEESNRDMYITYAQGLFDSNADIVYGITENQLVRTDGTEPFEKYLNLYFHISASTADILNPDVVKKFLALTHEQYKHRFGTRFSEQIAGFFTDEPQYYRAATPYTAMLPRYFQQRYGTDILDDLGLLFMEKEGYRTFRYRYWIAMQDLMLNSFAKQVYDWCSENDVQLTGHYVEETTLGAQMMCCAGVMPFYEYEHIPGIDWLGKETTNEVSSRQLNSAAQQLGKKQMLTESFACCGWNVTPAELKRIAGFQYACGVNMLCHHLLPYAEHGQRKRDYPAHFNTINPWITEHFKEFNDYFSRLGYLLSESKESVNVAILHPMRSAYLEHKRDIEDLDGFPGFPACSLDKDLQAACRSLSSRGIAYHFLDETLLEKHGFVNGDRIGCGQCAYTYLVIPKLLTMGAYTEKLLHQYVTGGGKILLIDGKPPFLEGEHFSYDYLASNCTMEDVLQAQPFAVENADTELYYTYRVYNGKPFIFVQNASDCKGGSQSFSFADGTASFTALDLISGKTQPCALTLKLEKNESVLLFLSKKPAPETVAPEIVSLPHRGKAELDTNYLTLDAVQYSKDGTAFSDVILCSELCQQLLRERYEGKLWVRYAFEIKELPESLYLLTEKNDSAERILNGKSVTFQSTLEGAPDIAVADIAHLTHCGVNHYDTVLNWHQSEQTYYALFGEGVTESLKNCIAYDSEIEAVYLAGKFGVYSHKPFEEWDASHVIGGDFYIGSVPKTVTEPVTDGLPFFRGNLTLTHTLELKHSNVCLSLDGDFLTAKVLVNGHCAGELCFQNTLDISPWVTEGSNCLQITYLVGNRNLLGPFHSSEDESFICPDSFLRNDLPNGDGMYPRYKLRRFYKT